MVALTETEARVLFSVLSKTWAPAVGYRDFMSGVSKLCDLGKGYACRDCTKLGKHASRYGGFCCDEHKAIEDARYRGDVDQVFKEAVTK